MKYRAARQLTGLIGLLLAGRLYGAPPLTTLDARRQALHHAYLQQCADDAARNRHVFDLRLAGALASDRAPARDLVLTLQVNDGTVTVARARSPQFNRSEHAIQAGQFRLADGVLAGSVQVVLRSDGYVPANNEDLDLAIELWAPLAATSQLARYDLTMPAGPGETGLEEVAGRVEIAARIPKPAALPVLPEDPPAACREAYRQCRALARALLNRSSLDETLADTVLVLDPDATDAAERMADAACRDVRPVTPGPRAPADPAFGPWGTVLPLGEDDALAGTDWHRPLRWRQAPGVPIPATGEVDAQHQVSVFTGTGDRLAAGEQALDVRACESSADGLVPAPPGERGHLAWTRFTVAQAGRIWVAVTPWLHELGRDTYMGRARLWVDDTLVWSSDDADRQQAEALAILPIEVGAGPHRLVVQAWRRNGGPAAFRLALCAGGAPLTHADLAAREAAVTAGIAREQARLEERVRGERINWRGHAPAAHPPLAWDEARGVNIAWRTPLPHGTIATPIVHNGRIFTPGNDHSLYCLDAGTGTRLWTGSIDPRELLPEDARRELEVRRQAASNAWTQLQASPPPTNHLALQQIVTAYHDAANRLGIEAFEFHPADVFSFRRGHYMAYGGAASTPVSDGRFVWARSIEGAVACFGYDGQRRWLVRQPVLDIGGIPGLLLIDDVLVVEGSHDVLLDRSRTARERWAVGLDAATGERRWRTRVANPPEMQGVGCTALGAPIPVALSDGTRDLTVVVTVAGTVLDPRNGRVLAEINLGTGGTRQNQGFPVAEGRRVLFPGQARHSAMVELHLLDDAVGVRRLWHAVCRHNNYGALLHDGRAWQHAWWFGPRPWKGHVSFMELLGLDAGNGRILNMMEKANREIAETTTFPQLLLTHGDVLWAGSTDTAPDSPFHGAKGTLTAIRIGPRPHVLARNHVERYVSSPVADGERLYLRTCTGMLCIGYTGAAGHAYERDTVAGTILEELPPRPVQTQPETLPALPVNAFPDAPAWTPRQPPRGWLYRALDGEPDAVLPGLGADAAPLLALDDGWQPAPETAWLEREQARFLDLLRMPDLAARRGLFLSIGRFERHGVFELDLKGGEMFRAWLAGRPVKPGRPLRLEPGIYALAVEVRVPPRLPFGNLFLGPRLLPVTDPDRAARQWRRALQDRVAALRLIVNQAAPDSPHLATAREMLRIAEEEP